MYGGDIPEFKHLILGLRRFGEMLVLNMSEAMTTWLISISMRKSSLHDGREKKADRGMKSQFSKYDEQRTVLQR